MADPQESSPSVFTSGESAGTRSLRDYWRVLVQRRWVVYTCLIAVVSVTMLLTFFTTPVYEAVTSIQIERQGPDILTFKDVMSADSSSYAYQDFYQTQYKILQSRSVVRIAVERLDLAARPEFVNRKPSLPGRALGWALSLVRSAPEAAVDPVESAIRFVQGGMAVRPIRNSQLVAIAFRDRNPELARDVADSIAEAYVAFNYKNKYGTTELAREFLTKEVAQAQAEIAALQRKLQEYGDKKKILAMSEGTQDISEQALADLNRRYVEAKTRRAVAQARYENAVGARPDSLPEVLNSSLIANLKQQHAEVERKYSQMAERFKEGWPPLMQLRQELDQAQSRLQQETLGIAVQVQSVAKADYERARSEMEHLEVQVDGQKDEVQRVNRDAVDYAGLQAEIDTKRKILSDLMARQTQTSSSERLKETSASNVRIVDKAQLPERPIKPNRLLNLVAAVLAATVLGVAGALFLDHSDNTIKDQQDFQRITQTPLVGAIPEFSAIRLLESDSPTATSPQIDLASHLDPRSVFAEAFKSLRTSLLLAAADRPPRVIVVSSCEPQDGKSTVAINLATVLAQLGRRVLLVDADLRKPRLHRALHLSTPAGLSTFLTGNSTFADVTQATEVPGLTAITSGPIPPNPSELLGSRTFIDLMVDLRGDSNYDHVILDSPPLMSVADPVIISQHVDALLLVVRAGKTAKETLAQSLRKLGSPRERLAGAVLNGIMAGDSYYHYYKAYGSYLESEERTVRRRRSKRASV